MQVIKLLILCFLQMPTEQKVLKIQEMIRYLRAHPA